MPNGASLTRDWRSIQTIGLSFLSMILAYEKSLSLKARCHFWRFKAFGFYFI